jgi:hypothetical protein
MLGTENTPGAQQCGSTRFRGVANRYLITFKMAEGLNARGLTAPALLLQAAVQIG